MEEGTRRLASAGAGRISDDPRRRGGGAIARSVHRIILLLSTILFFVLEIMYRKL